MGNYNPNDQQSVAEFILANLQAHKQFALGTTDETGRAWVVCLNLTLDKHLNFIWQSMRDAEHSKHVRRQPSVAICVFSETAERGDFGFYGRATARELTDPDELAAAIEARYNAKGLAAPPRTDFNLAAPARLYRAELQEAWITDDQHLKTAVDLTILRARAQKFNSTKQPGR